MLKSPERKPSAMPSPARMSGVEATSDSVKGRTARTNDCASQSNTAPRNSARYASLTVRHTLTTRSVGREKK